MKKRIKWIDICKGFLIVLVVLGHVIASYNNSGISNIIYETIFSVIYSFHMATFVFISGYLCTINKEKSVKNQVLKRIISYGIPYIVFSFIWVLFKVLFSSFVNTSIDFSDFIKIPLYPISFMWYLYSIMIMSIVQIFIEKYNRKVMVFISFICLLAKLLILDYYPNFSNLIICDFISFWFYFLIGHYYGEIIIAKISSSKMIMLVSFLLFLVCNILIIFSSNDILSFFCKIVTSLAGIFLILNIFNKIKKCKPLEYIGNKSLSIYVLQGIVIAASRIAISHFKILNDSFMILPLIICTIIGVLIPLIIELLCRKIWKIDFIFYPNKYIKIQ